MRILYVEDNQANVYLVKRVARNHTVINYIDGEEALRNFERDNPDLVLMDIQLAGRLDGIDVVKKLRSDGHTIPIIAVTAYAMVGDRERCIAAGCNDYISKPLPIPKLVTLFQEHDPIGKEEKPKTEATKAVDVPAKDEATKAVNAPAKDEATKAVDAPAKDEATKAETVATVESKPEVAVEAEMVEVVTEPKGSSLSEIDVTQSTLGNKTQPMPKEIDLEKVESNKDESKNTADVVIEKADASKKTP